ncbi:MAG: tetratricopeptide repeat protein [Pseudanabaena sp. RU_4_16]|nr:tetratricopeptide repeat protein [Pseudanabaena sp. RU_4_16]
MSGGEEVSGRWVELVVDFLKIWYRPEQRQGMLEKFGNSKLMAHHDLERAFLSNDDLVGDICSREFERALKAQNRTTVLQVAEELKALAIITDREYKEFVTLVDKEEYAKALKLLERSKSSKNQDRQPESFYEIFVEGLLLQMEEKWLEAIASFDRAVDIKPDFHAAWHNKGWAYFKLGRYPESINCFDRAIAIKPDQYNSWHDKGLVQFVTSDYQAALATWQQAFKYISDPEVPRYCEDISELIQEFITELIPRFTQPTLQQTLLIPLLEIYREAKVIAELGIALVNTLHLIVATAIGDRTAAQWLELWRTSSLGSEPAMELPLRLIETAIAYKKDPSKRQRLWLNLPSEERPILDQALKLSE